ncbi:EmrA family multidrug resistance transporter protein [Rhizobium phaseoli]|uniref:EmrA family multidrug resistance transporter protein n=2 Tax=Rhizobium TaxID=379 RepID=A0A192T924_9HYPH|nr:MULTISPECIES: HlyD family secretion protein [Rhizobium]ACE90265.1 probable protein secretion protein, HlyD family [Rhizobium etli CIAT 652]MDH6649149.1 membrane fusion protein (multidrug efflux system) [Rhizobium esperanzae]ANL27075.1 EmrA family multidrug resistance transporter protein [Rhizobium phaseoli]ANL39703.1 EmrA family multidrug resistance transporter protein [Rhizobium phaseoli]ANL52405.1 EmrA family multidrug resistance transporter protein [Rhizobium phaseoli]
MVELPRKQFFESAGEAERILAEEAARAPAAEAPATPMTGTPVAQAPEKTGRRMLKRAVIAAALLAGAAFAGDFGYRYWTVGRFIESTDDAYVKADYTTVAPKVAGYIKQVLVNDNDVVKSGQVLARIDDRDFQAALSQARADVKAAEAAITNIDAQIALQQSVIQQAKATVDASQASLDFAVSDAARSARLITNGAGTQSRAEQTQSARDQAAAAVERDRAALVAAENKVPVLRTEREQAAAQRDRAAAAAHQAELNLSYTDIVAAVDGTVGARSIRVGQYVTSGTQLMAVVPLHAVYVVANFKETQLTYVRPGQSVEIKVDSFPDIAIKGHVDSVSPASGLEFSLLPPDNATGNFTKIVQRIPVKIVIDDGALSGLLRSGMSVEPEVDTKAAQSEASQASGETEEEFSSHAG